MSAGVLGGLTWLAVGPILRLGGAPFLDGVGRRLRARLESRQGPPLLQGYIDLAKLSGKTDVGAGMHPFAQLAPYLALASATAAGLLLPIAGRSPLGFAGDGIVFVYLLGLSSVAMALAGSSGGSPFGFLGSSREMQLLFFVEPVVAGAICVLAIHAGTFHLSDLIAWQAGHGPSISALLAGLGVLLALLAYMGRIPFDVAEAEQELTGGTMVEFGGRQLALLRWTLFVRWLVVAWLVTEVFLPTPLPLAAGIPVAVLKVLALFLVASAASVLLARVRIDQARTYLIEVGLLILFAMVFALIGA